MTESDAHARFRELVRERALFRESVVLPSGARSSYSIDIAQVLFDPEGAALAGHLGFGALSEFSPTAVGGVEGAATALVSAVSAAAWDAGTRWTGFAVRGESRKYGLQTWIDGPFVEEGTAVAIVHGALETGESLTRAITMARSVGAEVVGALVAVEGEESAREAVEGLLGDAPLIALVTAAEVEGE